ncbi:MAG: hypothetical protein WC997_07360 [Porticoccaceae bacterium]
MNVTPKPAASVILVRETDAGSEALLVRKHAKLAFAGGALVFPGGKVEGSDALPDELYRAVPGARAEAAQRRTYIGAVCRETFEEIGVLLVRHDDGSYCKASVVEELCRHRQEIDREPSLFADFLRDNALFIHEEDFIYWSNWITPSAVPRRFDTHFYVAAMPGDQTVKCDTAESTELLWLNLNAFNETNGADAIPAPPTLFSLADLAFRYRESGSLAQLFRRELNRDIPRVMPKMLKDSEGISVMLPWHADYQSVPGEGVDSSAIPPLYQSFPSVVVASLKVPEA